MATIALPPVQIPQATTPSAEASFEQSDPKEYRWTAGEFQRLAELGFHFRRRVELIGGRIYQMAPQLDLHSVTVERVRRALEHCFGPAYWIRSQLPLQLLSSFAPEPDAAVVPGDPLDYVGKGQPKSSLLVVEVSDRTLRLDRRRKGPRYARAMLTDYWIVNLVDRRVEVYRDPVADPSAPLGWRYQKVSVLTPPATISPLAAPAAAIAVADLLP